MAEPPGMRFMTETADRCDLCGGHLRAGTTTLDIRRGRELVVVSDLTADVCQQCGEAYLSADVSAQLDQFLSDHHRHEPERCLAVPQYSAKHAIGR